FYDRDLSAALNIRRCAVGPGPRPTELCYWPNRPAMPKPGQPGQDWVEIPDKPLPLNQHSRDANSSGHNIAVGAQGRLTAQLAKALLEDGYNVIAGALRMHAATSNFAGLWVVKMGPDRSIDFPEQAKATLEFVKKCVSPRAAGAGSSGYELLDKATLARLKTVEVSAGDTSSAALASLPRGVKVVVVEGDSLGDKKGDARYVESAVATAQAAEASQVILVNSGAPDANLFSLFTASGSNPNKALTRSEQLLATSGLSYTILRAATSSEVSSSRPPLVVPGPGALALAPAPIAPGQLTQVLQGLMALPPSPPGVQVVLEAAAAAPAINPQPLEESVPRAVSSAVAKAPPPPPASGTKRIKATPPAPHPLPLNPPRGTYTPISGGYRIAPKDRK
ncbi:hypothetical protein QJQ45_019338, partial [Haematococcus lacustris]